MMSDKPKCTEETAVGARFIATIHSGDVRDTATVTLLGGSDYEDAEPSVHELDSPRVMKVGRGDCGYIIAVYLPQKYPCPNAAEKSIEALMTLQAVSILEAMTGRCEE